MRTFFLFLYIFCFVSQLLSQDYKVINKDNLYLMHSTHFTSSTNVYGIRADSFHVLQNDTIFYPYLQLNKTDSNCYDLSGPSVLGYQVISKNDGYDLLINYQYDTIYINRNAGLNENWLMYESEDSLQFWAEITSYHVKEIYTLEDSVKEITLHVLDNNLDTVQNYFTDAKIELSKNHGFLKSFFFRNFPKQKEKLYFLSSSSPEIGPQLFNWKSLFNFDNTTEFHRKYTFLGLDVEYCSNQLIEILESKKYLNRVDYGNDSIIYSIESTTLKKYVYDLTNTDSVYYEFSSKTNDHTLIKNVEFDKLPLIYNAYDDIYYNYGYDNVFENGILTKRNRAYADGFCYNENLNCFETYCIIDGQTPIYEFYACGNKSLLYDYLGQTPYFPCQFQSKTLYAKSPCNGNFGMPLDWDYILDTIYASQEDTIETIDTIQSINNYSINILHNKTLEIAIPDFASNHFLTFYAYSGKLLFRKKLDQEYTLFTLPFGFGNQFIIAHIENLNGTRYTKKLFILEN